jgi:hypothetical protein
MGVEHEASGQWEDLLSSALDDTAQPTPVNLNTNSVGALLDENARLRKLAIQLSNMLGNLPTKDSGACHSQAQRL